MIFTLQKRLTAAAACAMIIISICLVAAINLASGLSLKSQISDSLALLTGSQTDAEQEAAPAARERTRDALPAVPGTKLSRITNYCVIRLTRTGEIYEWKSENPSLYDDALVAQLTAAICAGGKSEGRIGEQAYRMEGRSYGALIVVLDVSAEAGYARTLLRITVIVGAGFCLALSLLAALLIRRMLRPVREAFFKQRQFVWDASHELKTPLAVISANAQALEGELGKNEYLGYIVSEARQAGELVQSLLTLARLDAGKQREAFERFDLGRTLLGAFLPMESLAFELGKTLRAEVPQGIFYTGNEALIRRLGVILLSNALQHSGQSSVVTLSLKAKGRRRLIRVHNTGSYIPPENQKRIFDRFYRAESSRSRETGGSGLGLAIAQSIAELHHGAIQVQSSRETGTAFTVTLYDRAGQIKKEN